MASTLIIPTEFVAVDGFTRIVKGMSGAVSSFTKAAGKGITGVNNAIDKSFSKLGNLSQLLLGLSIGGLFASAVTDLKNYEDGIASFRTIVSDLTDKEFTSFRKEIGNVAKDTNRSTIQVVESFEKIAGLNADFAKTSDGLANVSKQAIILSKASGDELGVSAENLVGIMNQYSLSADKAATVSNILAAGQAVGASSITQSSEAYKNFGSVAKGANITLEQSQGLIQTLGKYSLFGAEAGTKLRGVTLQLQKAGLGYASGQFQINDALLQVQKRLGKLGTAKKQDAYLTKIFGAENITAGKILSNNIDTFKKFTEGVTGTNAATEQAAIKSSTLTESINSVKNAFTNLITTNEEVGKGVTWTKNVMAFLAKNMDTVLTVIVGLLGAYAALKALMLVVRIVTIANSVAMGLNAAATGVASIAIGQNVIAMGAYKVASILITGLTYAWTAAQWVLNVALTANPIGIIIVAIAALIALVIAIIVKWDEWGAALSLFLGPLGWVISLIQSFRRNWDMVVKAFQTDGILGGLKAVGRVLLDAILMPVQQLLELLSNIPGLEDLAGSGAKKILELRQSLGVDTGPTNKPVKRLDSPQEVNQKVTQENRMKGNIDINLNDPGKNVNNVGSSGFLGMPVNIGSTQGAF